MEAATIYHLTLTLGGTVTWKQVTEQYDRWASVSLGWREGASRTGRVGEKGASCPASRDQPRDAPGAIRDPRLPSVVFHRKSNRRHFRHFLLSLQLCSPPREAGQSSLPGLFLYPSFLFSSVRSSWLVFFSSSLGRLLPTLTRSHVPFLRISKLRTFLYSRSQRSRQ